MTTRLNRDQKRLKNKDEEKNNPCLKEQNLSFRCLESNGYDHEKCEVFFQNYRNCKDFWLKVQRERRRDGIEPFLPDISDRDKIKAEYMSTKPK